LIRETRLFYENFESGPDLLNGNFWKVPTPQGEDLFSETHLIRPEKHSFLPKIEVK